MHIKSLTTTNFRNLTSVFLEPGTGVNVFYGDNGSGKSNLLEAIFTLCLGRSQRAASDTVLVNTDAELFRLEGSIESAGTGAEIAVAYQKGGRKKITLDSVTVRTSELYDRTCLVALGPEDSEILSGPPSARRLFMDLYLSQLSQIYLADLTDYQKSLSQKNAALRQEMDPTPFDPLLVACGSKVMLERNRFIRDLSDLAAGYHSEIAGGETFSTAYRPKVATGSDNADPEAVTVAFEAALGRYAERERVMQTSLVGPHRDEVEFEIGGLPARTHGSQGQWRTAAVALKLGIYRMLKQKRGSAPILLLDEIFAELDNNRAESLAGKFLEAGQLFLTTAVEPPKSLSDNAQQFRVVAGEVVEEN